MNKLRFLVSLPTRDNDFQIEQGNSAKDTAKRLGFDVEVLFAENDPVNQSTQILDAIQRPADKRPSGVVFEPVRGSGLEQVAKTAVHAGAGWAVLNRTPDYLSELRRGAKVPVFTLSSDHVEIGENSGSAVCGAIAERGHGPLYRGAVL